jgi:predicted TIM-barrel fold metal-dependent hydrolase
MTISSTTDTRYLLEWAREIGSSFPFFDCHIHPYDVLAGDVGYQANDQIEGVFSRVGCAYAAPCIEKWIEGVDNKKEPKQFDECERTLLLASRFLYTHTGPRVLADLMDPVGIRGALLVPVARYPATADHILEHANSIFSTDSRFLLGCPFPVGMQRDELGPFFCKAKEKWGIRAIKIHPNLAAVDPHGKEGHDLIEASLEAAGALDLPVVIHGGRTPGLQQIESRDFGRLAHLQEVNWSISSAPVVIAHAGCCALPEEKAIEDLPVLEKMLEKHSNLFVDISNLELSVLRLVMKTIDRKRLMYGSDALYVSVWQAWVSFLQILCEISPDPKSDLVQIASHTPARCLNISIPLYTKDL